MTMYGVSGSVGGTRPSRSEGVGEVLGGLDREATVDVDGAFRPAGRAGRVDDHVRGLRIGRRNEAVRIRENVRIREAVRIREGVGRGRALEVVAGPGPGLAPGHVALRVQFEGRASQALDHDDPADRWGQGDRFIGYRLE